MATQKTVLITGCSSGIGFETALVFARNGYDVYAGVRNPESEGATGLRHLAHTEKLPITPITLDITSQESITKAIKMVTAKTHRIDVLVNNAGVGYFGPVEDFSIDEVKAQYDTNILGSLRMIKAIAPIMRKQKNGRIITISSVNGLISFPLMGIYSSSKFALETLSEVLRFELAPFGIWVSVVEPGSFFTRFGVNRKQPMLTSLKSSPYKTLTDGFFTKYDQAHTIRNKFLHKITHPSRVAHRIYTIAQEDRPAFHNVVGVDAHLYLFLKRILPESIRFWLLQRFYDWK
jgi:NAD(P)-dependent dehydrogenase (short-subunit alcohol dehydrogenase family)